MTRKDHPPFKEKGSWASKSLSSLNPDNTWQSCDLNSEVSDSKALSFLSMPNCLSYMEEPVLGMGDTHTHTRCFSVASHVQFFVTPQTPPHQASLSLTVSWSLPKFMSIESVMPFNHLFLCCLLLLLASVFPSIRVFSNVWVCWFVKMNQLDF